MPRILLGYAQQLGDGRAAPSGVRSSASQPPTSPSGKSRLPPQQATDERGRSQQRQVRPAQLTVEDRWFSTEYPDGSAYGAEVEPEIAHLEAVINSFGRNAASMPPPSVSPSHNSPVVWMPRNGDHRQQHAIDGMKCDQGMPTNPIQSSHPLPLTRLYASSPARTRATL